MAGESYFDYAKTASDIGLHDMQKQKLKLDMIKDLPDDTGGADVMAGLAQSWNAPGQQRGAKGALRALFMGMASGMKGEANRAKRERLEKLLVGAEGWEDANNSMKQMLESKKQEALLNEKLQPAMDDLTVGSGSGEDANSLLSRANDWIKPLEAAGVVPTGSQVVGVLPDKYRLIYKTPDGQEKSINYLQKSSKGAQEKIKLILEQKGMDARTMSAEASMIRAENEVEMLPYNQYAKKAYVQHTNFDTNPKMRGDRAAHEEQGRNNAKYISEIQPKLESTDTLLSNLNEIEKVINDTSQTGSSPKDATWRFLAKKFGFDGTYSEDRMRMLLRSQFSKLPEVLGPGVKSDTDIKLFVEGMIGLDKNKKAVLEQIKFDKALTQNKSNLYRQQMKQYEQDKVANIHTSTANLATPNSIPDQKGTVVTGADGKGGGTTITLLKDGKTKTIPTSDYAKSKALAKQQGFGVVE